MQKNKKIITMIIITVLIVFCIFTLIIKNQDSGTSLGSNSSVETKVKKMLTNDYYINNLIYGNISLSATKIDIKDKSYYLVDNFPFKNFDEITKYIKNNYLYPRNYELISDLGKYNEIVSIDNKIYVLLNPKCNIPKFNYKEIKIKSFNKNKIKYIYKDTVTEFILIKNNKYKILNTPYQCFDEDETTTTKAEN